MTERKEWIREFNEASAALQQTPEALDENAFDAKRSLVHAEEVRGIAEPLQDDIWALEAEHGSFQEHQVRDKKSNSELQEVLNAQMGRLNPEWGEDLPPAQRWVSEAETIKRQKDAVRFGIRVRCKVQWGTGTANNPLLMINTILSKHSESYFPTHAAANPANDRHLSVAHMNDLKHAFNDPPGYWKVLALSLFQEFNGREVILYPKPFYGPNDGGMTLDTDRDPLASNPLVRMLISTYKKGQNRGFHITM